MESTNTLLFFSIFLGGTFFSVVLNQLNAIRNDLSLIKAELGIPEVSETAQQAILAALAKGDRANAHRLYRADTGGSLKEACDYVSKLDAVANS